MDPLLRWLRENEYKIRANTICRMRGHRWTTWEVDVQHVRDYEALGWPPFFTANEATRYCHTCWMHETRVTDEVESSRAIAEYRAEIEP